MMLRAIFNPKELLWAAAIGAGLTVLTQSIYTLTKTPVPYTNVQVVDSYVLEDDPTKVLIAATFDKHACEFVRLEVFSILTGYPVRIDWTPLDGRGDDYDRSAGFQYLIIAALPEGQFDALEIRTRHHCDDTTVDTLFATIETKDIKGLEPQAKRIPTGRT